MHFVQYELISPEKARVTLISSNNRDDVIGFGDTKEELEKKGILLEELPTIDYLGEGKVAVAFVNPTTKEFWYEYVERPLTLEEENVQLTKRVEEAENAIIALMDMQLMGGM